MSEVSVKFSSGNPESDSSSFPPDSSLWRVICFKKSVEPLRKTLREAKCSLREFTYSPTAYKELLVRSDELSQDFSKHELSLKRHCAAAFSDSVVAFVHLKAMRVFVESVLRYGVPAKFAAFIVKPTSAKSLTKLRGILGEVFASSDLFGKSFIATQGEDEGEAYYPYVNIPFSPLTPAVMS